MRAARRRADFDRGLAATSPGVGATARRVSSSASGSRPQPQMGRSGGQMQPRARSARNRFTRRSSSEWKEIAASLPSGARTSQASGSAASSCPSSSLTAIRSAWKVRLAGCAAGEPGRGRDRGLDDVDQLLRRLQLALAAPAADDRAGDRRHEAILAVAADQAGEAALVPLVDDLAGGQLAADRIHPHIQRRVVAVGEAALGVSTCIEERPGRGRPGRRARPRRSARQPVDERRAQNRVLQVDLGRELGEALLGDRVAVDPDQRAGRAEPVGDQARVAAATNRAVDGDLARLRVEDVDQLTGEDRNGAGRSVEEDGRRRSCAAERGGDVGNGLGQRGVLLGPGGLVPDLEAVARAGHHDLLGQVGMLAPGNRGRRRGRPRSSSVSCALAARKRVS